VIFIAKGELTGINHILNIGLINNKQKVSLKIHWKEVIYMQWNY